jgi:hypothetical protein
MAELDRLMVLEHLSWMSAGLPTLEGEAMPGSIEETLVRKVIWVISVSRLLFLIQIG